MNTLDLAPTVTMLIRLVRPNRSHLMTAVLIALCGLVLSGTIASANPESAAPVIVAAEPTPDVPDPEIDDVAPAPSPSSSPSPEPLDDKAPPPSPEPSPSPEPLDDKAPPPSPSPSPSPEPIDDVIPAPEDDPEQVGRVELTKATCAAGTHPGTLLDILVMTCLDDGAGYTFSLFGGHLAIPQVTVKDNNSTQGFASWDHVAVGNGTLTEELPAGFAAPVVYCKTILATGAEGPYELIPETGDAAIDYSLAAGDIFSCLWFNIPVDGETEYGDLTIYKYLCDGEVHTEGTCLPANAEFQLSPADAQGDAMLFAVGDDGFWSTQLPAGTYWELTELTGDPCWIQSADFTEGGTLPITADHETVVEVFNCTGTPDDAPNDPGDVPNDPDYPEITKLPDTGSGPMLAGAGRSAETTIALALAGLAVLGAGLHRSLARKEATR